MHSYLIKAVVDNGVVSLSPKIKITRDNSVDCGYPKNKIRRS